MEPSEVLFLCTADARVGFGHLRRCLTLATRLDRAGVRVAFGGDLDAAAREQLRAALPQAPFGNDGEGAPLAVLDCMFDPQDPDHYDLDFLRAVAVRHERVVLVTSSIRVPPDLPVTAVVGHVLEPVARPIFTLYRGLEWAPVAPEAATWRDAARDFPDTPRRVLVAFGNWADPAGARLALEALDRTGWPCSVQVLLPPALRPHLPALARAAGRLAWEVQTDVPSVFPLLHAADLLVGSYGNLTFEALAPGVGFRIASGGRYDHLIGTFGAPLPAVGAALGLERVLLAALGALINAGEVGDLTPSALAGQLAALTVSTRRALGQRGRALVDGQGLARLADLLMKIRDAGPLTVPAPHLPQGSRISHA